MIARLQQTLCCAMLALAVAWWWLARDASALLAWAGVAVVLGGYPMLLACEFGLLRLSPPVSGVPRAGGVQLLRAWLGELRHGCAVFFWRQPFRAHAVPDQAQGRQRGVVFVHGLFCNRGFWTPWMRMASAKGIPFMALNLEPPTGSIDGYVPLVEDAVRRLTAATGQAPVLICHSMGGLAARAWLAATADGAQRVARVVTIASPHAGTWMARFGHGANARQMELDSAWLQRLSAGETAAQRALFTCWCSDSDNIVFPHATAALPGADNRWVAGAAHVALAFEPRVMRESLAFA